MGCILEDNKSMDINNQNNVHNTIDEYRKEWIENQKRLIETMENNTHSLSCEMHRSTIEYSKIAINGAFLLNGAAGIAILYNFNKINNPESLIILCAFGAICAILCAGVSYIAQRVYHRHLDNKSKICIEYNYKCLFDIVTGKNISPHPQINEPRLGHC